MRESRTLEYKESITNTFLKTVSAFANYGSGEIIFGIADDGRMIGIPDPKAACLDIENRINDSIDPVPEYTLSINEKTSVITRKYRKACISHTCIRQKLTGEMTLLRLPQTGLKWPGLSLKARIPLMRNCLHRTSPCHFRFSVKN